MPVISNVNGIGKVMLGSSNEITRIYVGTNIVYDSLDYHVFEFTVPANGKLILQDDRRGAKAAVTDWGDGAKNNELTHTYTTAGTYTVKTTLSIATTYVVPGALYPYYDIPTASYLTKVTHISRQTNSLDYMFYGCRALNLTNISFDGLDLSKFNSAVATFASCCGGYF